jgi:hypothetical protein
MLGGRGAGRRMRRGEEEVSLDGQGYDEGDRVSKWSVGDVVRVGKKVKKVITVLDTTSRTSEDEFKWCSLPNDLFSLNR